MALLLESEKSEIKNDLTKLMSKYIDKFPDKYQLGYWPADVDSRMAEAAMLILLTINEVNSYLEVEGIIIKD